MIAKLQGEIYTNVMVNNHVKINILLKLFIDILLVLE